MPTSGINSTWPPGLPRSLHYPDVPVHAVLRGAARRWAERPAFVLAEQSLSFSDLYRRACRVANVLRDGDVRPGDVVAVHLPNGLRYPEIYYGILLAGGTFSPTNPLLPADDLAHQLRDSQAVAVVTCRPGADVLASVMGRTAVRRVYVSETSQSRQADDSGGLAAGWEDLNTASSLASDTDPRVRIDTARDLAHLAYTGGTTGRSKGVELTHRNVVSNTLQFACWNTGSMPSVDDEGDLTVEQLESVADEFPVRLGTGVGINVTPWFHAMGTVSFLGIPVLTGVTTVIHPRFDPGAYVADAVRWQVTGIGGAPPLFHALLRVPGLEELRSVRSIISGAAPLAADLLKRLSEAFPDAVVREGYGLTETTMGAITNPNGRSHLRKVGSVGLPVADTSVMIVAADEVALRELPPGEPGEICLRGPQIMRGYHDQAEATAEVLVDGWLRTGDVGRVDEDGYLFIVDRKKDMLIYKGYNVYPRELEELLFAHPDVLGCAVLGKPDRAVGEIPVAFVVLAPGSPVNEETLLTDVAARVLPYKRLREVHFVDEIPTSAAGKVLKRELRQRLGT